MKWPLRGFMGLFPSKYGSNGTCSVGISSTLKTNFLPTEQAPWLP